MPANGRPSSYTQEIADTICTRIAEGESLRTICVSDDIPSITSVRRWLADEKRDGFRLQYACAREEQADFYADAIIEIADTEEDPQKARVRIDARKWYAGKLKPKKYGERIASPVTISNVNITADGMTDAELEEIANKD